MKSDGAFWFAILISTAVFGILLLYDAPTWGAMGFGFVAFWLTLIRFDPRARR